MFFVSCQAERKFPLHSGERMKVRGYLIIQKGRFPLDQVNVQAFIEMRKYADCPYFSRTIMAILWTFSISSCVLVFK